MTNSKKNGISNRKKVAEKKIKKEGKMPDEVESIKSADLLSAELGGCLAFPLEAIPNVLHPLILEGAEAMQCPSDYIGVPLLTACGAAVGRTHVVEIKPGWRESTALWTAVVGGTGTTKTPPHDLTMRGLHEIQTEWLEEFKQKYATYKQDEEGGTEPTLKRILASDTTVEALGVVMRDNPRGIILARDEMSGWMNSMNQYKGGRGSDYQFFLSAWSGCPWQIDRKNLTVPIIIPHTYLAVSGTVTPAVLTKLLNEERQTDGFAARLLISYPPEVDEQWTDKGISESTIRPVVELQKRLSRLGFQRGKQNEPNVIQFSEKGREAFREVMEEHLGQLTRYELSEPLAAYWPKMKGYTARLSLIIHLIRLHSGKTSSKEISSYSVYMAAALIDYFKAHTLKFYGNRLQIQTNALHERIIQWAKRHEKREIAPRDIIAARIISNADTTRIVLDQMALKNLGKWKDQESKRKFILTPTQQSATQQNRRERYQTENQSKWLMKVRRIQSKKVKKSR
ncbi:YfjI family protein [Planctomycetota bacterium]